MSVEVAQNECTVCQNRCTMIVDKLEDADSADRVEKCRKWLEEITVDCESVCSCDSGDPTSTDCSSSTFDDKSYDSNGISTVDKMYGEEVNGANLEELQVAFNKTNNTYQNVFINKSKKIHLGNVTYINGPIFINKPQDGVINQPHVSTGRPKQALVRYVDRKNWLAQPALAEAPPLPEPAKYVIITHSATEDGSTHAENILLVRLIQQFHIESRNWDDIAYNFLIGNDGNTYIGRGWGKEGAHTLKYNRLSVGICFVGCFINKMPPLVSLKQAKALIEEGVENGCIDENYSLLGHSQCLSSESPGRMLFEEIKTWPHFDDSINVENPSPLLD